MHTTIKIKKAEARHLINATFPDWKGRKIQVDVSGVVYLCNLNWDGGSRSQFRACTLEGRRTGSMDSYNQTAPWLHEAEGAKINIPEGHCVIRHSICMGKDCGLTIHINPNDAPKWIEG